MLKSYGIIKSTYGAFHSGKRRNFVQNHTKSPAFKNFNMFFFLKKTIFAAFRPFLEEKFFGNFLGVARNENKLLSWVLRSSTKIFFTKKVIYTVGIRLTYIALVAANTTNKCFHNSKCYCIAGVASTKLFVMVFKLSLFFVIVLCARSSIEMSEHTFQKRFGPFIYCA